MTTFGNTGTIQHFTAGAAGEYMITADGAQGGGVTGGPAGGDGAAIGGEIFLAAGAKLDIVVGGEGGSGLGGGGGGASIVIETFNGTSNVDIIEAVAGGGGGATPFHVGLPGEAGSTGAAGGMGGGAGGVHDAFGHGALGGGGGFTGGAGVGASLPTNGSVAGVGFHGGAAGGSGGEAGAGGFGGGGGGFAAPTAAAGGGGGGYGGGGGGSVNGVGGGGGSFFNGAATTDAGGVHTGAGVVTVNAVCFVSGTLISTGRGEVPVEDLRAGDLAGTASGAQRPIRWVGHRRITGPTREQWPVRVAAGAFCEGLPRRDLFLSPGHAVCVGVMDEVFIPVGELVNGATIAPVEVPDVTYWHVELESHDVLLAEGLPAESYMDAGNRNFFGREHGRLAAVDPERAADSLAYYARPFVNQGPIVAAVKQRLIARAEALGWRRSQDAGLHLEVDGARFEPNIDGGLARFVFPAEAKQARLVSRTFVPGNDCRSLGVRIEGLHISDGLRASREVPLDEIACVYPEEAVAGLPWRWTAGELLLPADLWADCRGFVILRLAFAPSAMRCWMAPEAEPLRAVA